MRIIDIIKSDLASDKLKLEEELERIINDKSLETNDKVATIKKIIREVALLELSYEKFKTYTDEDNEEKK